MTLAFIGPFEYHAVVVHGWSVPFLTATPENGGHIVLTLDRRTSLNMTVAEAERIVPFIADCIAVALGYTAHPGCDGLDEPLLAIPMHRLRGIYTEDQQ